MMNITLYYKLLFQDQLKVNTINLLFSYPAYLKALLVGLGSKN